MKALDHIKEFSNVTALIDHFMDPNNTLEQEDGTLIKLSKVLFINDRTSRISLNVALQDTDSRVLDSRGPSPTIHGVRPIHEFLLQRPVTRVPGSNTSCAIRH